MWIRFSACAAESADSTLDCTLDFERWGDLLEPSATSRGKHSRSRVWVQRFKKGGWTKRLSGAAICNSCPWTSYPESTTSPEAIRASLLAPLASARASKTHDTCGRGCSSASRLFDLEGSSSRTSRATFRWGCSTSCPIWKAAVTERRGAATRRRLSALHTDANESSSSGWPTPRASTGGPDPHGRKTGKNLQHAVNWPTPVAGDSEKQPTNSLHHRVVGKGPTSRPGQLNPDWVEMLMGFPVGWTDCAPSETQ